MLVSYRPLAYPGSRGGKIKHNFYDKTRAVLFKIKPSHYKARAAPRRRRREIGADSHDDAAARKSLRAAAARASAGRPGAGVGATPLGHARASRSSIQA